jgi:hypothetical protein
MPRQTVRLTFNSGGATVRRETLHGRDYLVAPAVMMTEGVRNGNKGPIYYSDEFLAKSPSRWDHKPIVVYHPEKNGKNVPANDPAVLNASGVGFLLKTKHTPKKWKTECWFDVERVKTVDRRVYNALTKNKPVELSTGLDLEVVEDEGEFGGQSYTMEAVDHDPDHLAILPDKKGACSLADGAGLCVNQRAERRIDRWEGKCRRFLRLCGFELSPATKRVPSTKTANGDGRRNGGQGVNSTEEDEMKSKKKMVDGLIANEASPFDEKDRPWLMSLSEDRIGKIVANHSTEDEDPGDEDDGDDKPVVNASAKGGNGSKAGKKAASTSKTTKAAKKATPPAKGKKVANEDDMWEEDEEEVEIVANDDDPEEDEEPAPRPRRKPLTYKQLLANADGPTRAILNHQRKAYLTEKKRLIKTVLKSPGNEFTTNELNEIADIEHLRKLAALAATAGGENIDDEHPTRLPASYFGQQGAAVLNESVPDDFAGLPDPCTVPVRNSRNGTAVKAKGRVERDDDVEGDED